METTHQCYLCQRLALMKKVAGTTWGTNSYHSEASLYRLCHASYGKCLCPGSCHNSNITKLYKGQNWGLCMVVRAMKSVFNSSLIWSKLQMFSPWRSASRPRSSCRVRRWNTLPDTCFTPGSMKTPRTAWRGKVKTTLPEARGERMKAASISLDWKLKAQLHR